MFLFNNNSTDSSTKIAKAISEESDRIIYKESGVFLSNAESFTTSLKLVMRFGNFDHMMLIGGDDYLTSDEYLSVGLQALKDSRGISGVIPSFTNQMDSTLFLKINKIKLLNRIRLVNNWQYVHIFFGIYKKEVWEKFEFLLDNLAKDITLDWWFSLLALKQNIKSQHRLVYFKLIKNLNYNSSYYQGPTTMKSYKLMDSKSNALQNWGCFNIRHYINFFRKPFFDTINFFNTNSVILRKEFPIEDLIFRIVYFYSIFSKPFKFKMNQFRKKFFYELKRKF
jgi:hypothetical protein